MIELASLCPEESQPVPPAPGSCPCSPPQTSHRQNPGFLSLYSLPPIRPYGPDLCPTSPSAQMELKALWGPTWAQKQSFWNVYMDASVNK